MGKKGTKRKTKWRALPLGEEAGGSGNEEDLFDEDQSTTSSVIGGQNTTNTNSSNINVKRQPFYYKLPEKPFRQTRRFGFDRFRGKEPLVKLESKTFDEEEYTKITTPRQDVLFKKGYFGRKRESSLEESAPPTGDTEGEEPMMDQIIITNGFVDERGHYLVNGNSYEIYDPYSNTVTVVVGPPPYANGVTQPVLAAVSCQPVPLQPVDWYPPGADWPSQGSAWTPSYVGNPSRSDSAGAPDVPPNFTAPDSQISSLYNQPAYVVPAFGYGESLFYNGAPVPSSPSAEAQESEDSTVEAKKTRRKSMESAEMERKAEPSEKEPAEEKEGKEDRGSPVTAQHISKTAAEDENSPTDRTGNWTTAAKEVEKQSHSTQTNLPETMQNQRMSSPRITRESHSTQTSSEQTFQNKKADAKPPEKDKAILSEVHFASVGKTEGETNPGWKLQGSRYGSQGRKLQEDSPRKVWQQRTHFGEERRPDGEKSESSPVKVSYAKKAMSGLENGNLKTMNHPSVKIANGGFKHGSPLVNGLSQEVTTNGTNKPIGVKQVPGHEERRNGFAKGRYGRGKPTTDRTGQRCKERRPEAKPRVDPDKKCEETANESRTQSEKSSTVSELSSPMDLSSGQNTPPEKSAAQKMEEEINESFEKKLKENLSKTERETKQGEEDDEEEEEKVEKREEKAKGKKKKNKGREETEKVKEGGRGNKKRKKRGSEEAKEKFDSDNSSEEIPFLSRIRQKDLLCGSWEGLKDGGQDFFSEMGPFLNGDKEILESLGLHDDRVTYSKLPLHSDLLTMLPTLGWSRPKLKIEDFFAPAAYQSDLFTRRNITSMKSTKPEEFFASVIDGPSAEKSGEKKKETPKKTAKSPETSPASKSRTPKTACKAGKTGGKRGSPSEEEEEKSGTGEGKEGKLGIVEAVNTWLQEQGKSGGLLAAGAPEEPPQRGEENSGKSDDQKNGSGNPIHASCHSEGDARAGEFREEGGCIRVANVINDGFIHVSKEFPGEKKLRRMYRSSSWDTKLSEINIKKHFKFLTDSASFCQDLISDVRNGLPAGDEYATEELCDPKQTVTKYYILAPNGKLRNESDSENEVFDALEYKFLSKENREADGKSPDGRGNASITDSGVHSDVESSEDTAADQQKEAACKLQ